MKKFLAIIALVMLAASCTHEPETKIKHGDVLKLTTESALLSEGDLVGINMDHPFAFVNVKTTYSSGSLTPGNELYWPYNQRDSAVNFIAYYHYTAEYNDGGTVVFSAAPDQRDDAAFKASALLVAHTKASVAEPSVAFDFIPRMTKLVFYLRNETDSPVQDIYLTAYPSLQFNMDKVNLRVCGEKVDLHAHLSATSADGVQAFETIFAPQNTALTLTIKTASAEFTAALSSTTTFEAARQYSNAKLVVLNEKKMNRVIGFTLQESEWKASPDFVYQEPPAGGAELEDLTDPGVYKIVEGAAFPLRIYEPGDDQFSLITGGNTRGWRVMDPILGNMFEFCTPMVYSQEGNTFDINIRSFGIENFEADYSSRAKTIRVEDKLAWIMDEKKDYGYIIVTE